jgi:hypothetical protein
VPERKVNDLVGRFKQASRETTNPSFKVLGIHLEPFRHLVCAVFVRIVSDVVADNIGKHVVEQLIVVAVEVDVTGELLKGE